MENQNETGEKSGLWDAYAKAWAEVENVTKNAHNPHFGSNYADLAAVNDTYKPIFAKYGLALYQSPGRLVEVGGKLAISIVNVLVHGPSGQTFPVETQIPLGDKADAQKTVAATTYGRRCAGAAISGIAQVDDDGNEAAGRGRSKRDDVQAEELRKQIKAFTGSPEELEAALAPAVRALNDDSVATAYKAKRKELRGSNA